MPGRARGGAGHGTRDPPADGRQAAQSGRIGGGRAGGQGAPGTPLGLEGGGEDGLLQALELALTQGVDDAAGPAQGSSSRL